MPRESHPEVFYSASGNKAFNNLLLNVCLLKLFNYRTGKVHVAFTTSPNVIQLSGDARLLQDVKTGLKQFVQKIVHKTVTFRRAGRKISKTCAV